MRLGRAQRIVVIVTLIALVGELFWPRVSTAWYWSGRYRHDLAVLRRYHLVQSGQPDPINPRVTRIDPYEVLHRQVMVWNDEDAMWSALWAYDYTRTDLTRIGFDMLGTVLVSAAVLLAVGKTR